jgi:parallel beta-helix repeat protein
MMLVATLTSVFVVKISVADPTTIYVHPGESIQDAIDVANPGDTIFVYSGTYYEHVIVSKTINLIGEHRDSTIINGSGSGYVVDITADWVNMSGFTVQNGHYGIHLFNPCYSRITGNNANSNTYGIYLSHSSNNILTGNNLSNNYLGINLYQFSNNNKLTGNNANFNQAFGILISSSCTNTSITSNNVSNNDYGIDIQVSSNNTIIGNNVNSNGLYGIELYHSNNNIVIGNNASNNYLGIYLSGSNSIVTGNNLNSNEVFGILLSGTNNTITSNNVSNNDYGIDIGGSNNTISGNNLNSNELFGIELISSDNNTITSNNVNSNNDYGIELYDSSSNTITSNNVSYNPYGIYLFLSSDNSIYNNYFSNTKNAYDDGNNMWNISKTPGTNIIGGPYLGGNYWDDYTGSDNDGDGIGDVPYPISGGDNEDRYPLMEPNGSENNPPNTPTITGQKKVKINVEYTYTSRTTDPEEDQVYYWFEWGDGTNSGWIGSYASGATASAKHKWTEKGTCQIKVKAKDIQGDESDWATLEVIIPRTYNPLILKLLERFPNAFPIIRHLLINN